MGFRDDWFASQLLGLNIPDSVVSDSWNSCIWQHENLDHPQGDIVEKWQKRIRFNTEN